MRVLVCGGRDYDNEWAMMKELRKLPRHAILVHGAATGADQMAERCWKTMGRRTEAHPADTEQFGPNAYGIQNQEIVDSGLDLVVAFPGGNGTLDMVSKALAAGVPVMNPEMLSIVDEVLGTEHMGFAL